MDIDLAQDMVDVFGVKLKIVPVRSSNRMQFVEKGKIDMMIATMSNKANRCKVISFFAVGRGW